jgi:hypothetical protein
VPKLHKINHFSAQNTQFLQKILDLESTYFPIPNIQNNAMKKKDTKKKKIIFLDSLSNISSKNKPLSLQRYL